MNVDGRKGTVPRNVRGKAWLLLLPACGAVLVWIATHHGLGITPDSVGYFSVARGVARGAGFVLPGPGQHAVPLTHWPPLYPAVLALFEAAGLDVVVAARVLAAVLFAVNIYLVQWTVYLRTRQSLSAALLAGCGMTFAGGILPLHMVALSEPLFLAMVLLTLLLLVPRDTASGWGRLLAGAAAVAVACLTRYVGVAVVAAGVVAVCLVGSGRLRQRIGRAAVFGSVGTLPLALWLLRNRLAADGAVGRSGQLVWPGAEQWAQGAKTVFAWVVPVEAGGALRYAAGVWILAAAAVCVVLALRQRQRAPAGAAPEPGRGRQVLGLFMGGYVAVLVAAMIFLHPSCSLNARYLSPVFAAGVMLAASACHELIEPAWRFRSVRWAFTAFLGPFLLMASWQTARTVAISADEGIGYAAPAWRESAVLDGVRELPDDVIIFSNAPRAIQWYTGRFARPVPRRYKQAEYRRGLAQMKKVFATGQGVLVTFDRVQARAMPPPEELVRELGLFAQDRRSDGTIWSVRPAEK